MIYLLKSMERKFQSNTKTTIDQIHSKIFEKFIISCFFFFPFTLLIGLDATKISCNILAVLLLLLFESYTIRLHPIERCDDFNKRNKLIRLCWANKKTLYCFSNSFYFLHIIYITLYRRNYKRLGQLNW